MQLVKASIGTNKAEYPTLHQAGIAELRIHCLRRKNIPPELEALVAMPNMEHSCKNFSLGPNGLFWYTYRSVKDVYEQSEFYYG